MLRIQFTRRSRESNDRKQGVKAHAKTLVQNRLVFTRSFSYLTCSMAKYLPYLILGMIRYNSVYGIVIIETYTEHILQ